MLKICLKLILRGPAIIDMFEMVGIIFFECDVKNMFEVDIERSSYHRYVWNGGDK